MVASEAVVLRIAHRSGQGLMAREVLAGFCRLAICAYQVLAETFDQRPGRCGEQVLPGSTDLPLERGVSGLNWSEDM